jgi:hypothetical protein
MPMYSFIHILVLDSVVKEKEYFDMLKTSFSEDKSILIRYAKEHLFFTSAKNNINVQKSLSKILNKINQNEGLWKKLAYEKVEPKNKKDKKKEGTNEEATPDERGFFAKLFCCNPRKTDVHAQMEKEEEDLLEEQEENMRFQEGWIIILRSKINSDGKFQILKKLRKQIHLNLRRKKMLGKEVRKTNLKKIKKSLLRVDLPVLSINTCQYKLFNLALY